MGKRPTTNGKPMCRGVDGKKQTASEDGGDAVAPMALLLWSVFTRSEGLSLFFRSRPIMPPDAAELGSSGIGVLFLK